MKVLCVCPTVVVLCLAIGVSGALGGHPSPSREDAAHRGWDPVPATQPALEIDLPSETDPFSWLLLAKAGEAGVRNIVGAVFRLRSDEPDYEWPVLEFSVRLVLAGILGAIGACLSSAGGVGGGGLYVPLFNLLVGFDAKTAAALSNFMILGGSFSNLSINLQQVHPEVEGEPLVDYDAALLLEPNILLGISLGVICNVMFPAWTITALLAVTLFYMTTRSLNGACRRWAHESRKKAADAEEAAHSVPIEKPVNIFVQTETTGNGDLRTPLLDEEGHRPRHGEAPGGEAVSAPAARSSSTALFLSIPDFDVDDPDSNGPPPAARTPGDAENLGIQATTPRGTPIRRKLTTDLTFQKVFKTMSADSVDEHGLAALDITPGCIGTPFAHQYPLKKLGMLALVWFVFFAVQVLRSSKGLSLLHLETCGVGYWLLTVSQVPIALGFTFWAAHFSHAPHQELGEPPSFSQKAGGLLPIMAFLAGLLGGLLGIGGGMIVNPLLLEIGMLPQVTAATCAFMVFFSSSMSVVQYWLLGRIPLDYAIVFAGICFVFSFVGQIVVQRIIIKYGRASIIVFSVSTVIGLSAIATAGFGGYEIIMSYLRGEYMGFQRPC